MSATRKTGLNLDVLEARLAPSISIDYALFTPGSSTTVVSGKPLTTAPSSPFAGVKVDLGTPSLGSLVGWPPIKVA
jgi:hypothetical protein